MIHQFPHKIQVRSLPVCLTPLPVCLTPLPVLTVFISGREQCGDMSFLDDLKQIENDRKKKDKGNSSGAQSSHLPPVSPGRERWSLNRKDSIHSLASEPNKNDPTPFQRGAMSVSSLNRLIFLLIWHPLLNQKFKEWSEYGLRIGLI